LDSPEIPGNIFVLWDRSTGISTTQNFQPSLPKNLSAIKGYCYDSGLIRKLKTSHIHLISGTSASVPIIFAHGKLVRIDLHLILPG
jgi:hypothetical protein